MFVHQITSENAPKAIGPYSPAVKLGDFVYLSGQIPVDPTTGNVVEGGIKEQTERVMKNIVALLDEIHLSTRHIVKTTVFINNMDNFATVNEVYASYFDPAYPAPARSCVEVSRLPKDVLVEIECLVIDTLVYEQQMNQGCKGCSQHGECCDQECGGCDSNECGE